MGARVPRHEDNDRFSRVSARRVVTVPRADYLPQTAEDAEFFGQDERDIVM